MRCKTFALLYDQFTQDNTYQILSELVSFCRRDGRKHFGVSSVHSVVFEKFIYKTLVVSELFYNRHEFSKLNSVSIRALVTLMITVCGDKLHDEFVSVTNDCL